MGNSRVAANECCEWRSKAMSFVGSQVILLPRISCAVLCKIENSSGGLSIRFLSRLSNNVLRCRNTVFVLPINNWPPRCHAEMNDCAFNNDEFYVDEVLIFFLRRRSH